VRPCHCSLFYFSPLLLLFVLCLISFKSLVIEVAVLCSARFASFPSFALIWPRCAQDSPVGPFFTSSFLLPFHTLGFAFLVSILRENKRYSQRFFTGYTANTRRVLSKGEIHSLFDYSTFSVLLRFRHKVFLHEQEYSPLIRPWKS
jgi:hypothetical protein